MIIFDIIIFIYLLIKFILKYFYNKLSINYFLFFILIWGLGIGDWGLGIGDWAQSPIPNPQSPIPNPLKKLHKINIIFYHNKN